MKTLRHIHQFHCLTFLTCSISGFKIRNLSNPSLYTVFSCSIARLNEINKSRKERKFHCNIVTVEAIRRKKRNVSKFIRLLGNDLTPFVWYRKNERERTQRIHGVCGVEWSGSVNCFVLQ